MAKRDIIVIGASAGGVGTLAQLVKLLPKDLQASLFIVLHIPSENPSTLPDILTKKGPLPAHHPKDEEPIQRGKIYVAPPNHHLLVREGFVNITTGPRENGHRPAVDSLFRSASQAYGNRVIGIVLSGYLDDGSGGLLTVKRRGGVAIVQDPKEALFPDMPKNAIQYVEVDYVLPVSEIAPLLLKLVDEEVEDRREPAMEKNEKESEMAKAGEKPKNTGKLPGPPSAFTCPECGGTLWEREEGKLRRYECHVGHGYSPQSLVEGNSSSVEAALWTAFRMMEERVALCRRLATNAQEQGTSTGRYDEEAQEAERRASLLRDLLHHGNLLDVGSLDEATT